MGKNKIAKPAPEPEITTCSIFRADRARLEKLRLKHSFEIGRDVKMQHFFTVVIDFYEKNRR